MTDIQAATSEPPHPGSMTVHERNVLALRLVVSCGVLLGPMLLVVALVVYALYRSEETHPWSHRSVACATPGAVAAIDSEPSRES